MKTKLTLEKKMKKQFIILLVFLITSTSISAQILSSGDLTVSISNLKTRSYTQDVFGTIHEVVEYIGDYTIKKKGFIIKSHDFNTQSFNRNSMILWLNDDERKGYPLEYDFNTKKYEIGNKKFKAKNSKDIENIILSGILIHAKWFKD